MVLLIFHGTKSSLKNWRVSVKEECWTVIHLIQIGREFPRSMKTKLLKMEELKPHTQSQCHPHLSLCLCLCLLFLFPHR